MDWPSCRSGNRPGPAGIVGLALSLIFAGEAFGQEAPQPHTLEGVAEADAPSDGQRLKAWILATADNQELPFVIIDKVRAEVRVFDRDGQSLGTAPVLLGLARGDISPPGIGDRPLSTISPDERVTPAGRFVASLGENLSGTEIVWIDYGAALSMHPVVTNRSADRRLERLATETVDDNRISYGCVNVPVGFYEAVVRRAFRGTVGVVYILPEHLSLEDVFSIAPNAALAKEISPG